MKNEFASIEEQQIYALRYLLSTYDYNRQDMAKDLGVELGTVNQWFARGRISANKAMEVERITGGDINKKFMRPDVKEWI